MPGAAISLTRLLSLGALAAAFQAAPAAAQVAVEVALQSDYRLRGFSVSGERPVAAHSIAYDDPSGVYLGGTAFGVVRNGEPGILSVNANIGYATRISPGLSLDGGVSRFEYFSAYGAAQDFHYTEVYVGLATRALAARVRYSPDYYRPDTETLYAEVDGGVEVAPNWLINGHVGTIYYLDPRPGGLPRRRYDWRLGATRQIGRFGVHVDVSGRIAKRDRGDDKTAVVLSLTRAF